MILGTLPPALDDELLYSFMARVQRSYRGVISYRFLKTLNIRHIAPLLPRELEHIARIFPPGSELNADELRRKFSILPYYESTLDHDKIRAAREYLSGPLVGRRLTFGYKGNERQHLLQLRSCPECVREDVAATGEAAWKRSHNLPEVYVCHKHGLPLEAMTTPRSDFDLIVSPGPERSRLTSPHRPNLTYDLACDSHWLLNSPERPTSMETVKQVLRLALLGTNPEWQRNGKVYRHILETHSGESLRRLGLPYPFHQVHLLSMIGFSRGLHPLRVMLIAHITGYSVRSLLFDGTPTEQGLDLLWRRSGQTIAQPSTVTVKRLRKEVLEQDLEKPVTAVGKVARDRLRRADPAWYGANVPPLPDVTHEDMRRSEDERLAQAVRDEADRMYAERPHVRVSMRRICFSLDITPWKAHGNNHAPDNYPKTKAALRLASESGADFHLRKRKDRLWHRIIFRPLLPSAPAFRLATPVQGRQKSQASNIRTLTDEQWERIANHLHGHVGPPERGGVDNRLFVDAVLWKTKNAARWRDLPKTFGKWKAVYLRFNRWSHTGVWEQLFLALADMPDFEFVLVDGAISEIQADAARVKRELRLPPPAGRMQV